MLRLNIVSMCIVYLVLFLVAGCSDSNFDSSSNNTFKNVYPANEYGKYALVLKECIAQTKMENGCSLDELPFIGMDKVNPDKEAIMDRLVVSHDWMAHRFSQLLDKMHDSVYPLFKSVTAIVIDHNIKPSFYRLTTGAIYLDPNYLWITREEKSTIPTNEDFRSTFDVELKFRLLIRYVINNEYAPRARIRTENGNRTADDILFNFARLLYHELGHAVDRASPAIFNMLDRHKPVGLALKDRVEHWASWKLYVASPLLNEQLKGLAAVRYRGVQATEHQKQITASYVGSLVENDRANHFYNYATVIEDTAVLFEATMMKYHFDAELDFAFTHKPEDTLCASHLVSWGVRNRIALTKVKRRALIVVNQMLPTYTDWHSFFESDVGGHTPMRVGDSWCQNLVLTSSAQQLQRHNEFAKEKANKQNKQSVDISEIRIPYL